MPEPEDRDVAYVAAEYAATNATYLQYDAFRWQAGGLLFAGAFVFLGFLISEDTTAGNLFVGSLIVAAVMSFWMLYAQHYRQLYLFKIDTMLELEHSMGAEQHRRFHRGQGVDAALYPRIGVRGHHLDQLVYSAITLGGPLLAVVEHKWSWPMWIAVALVPLVVVTVQRQDRKLIRFLQLKRSTTPPTPADQSNP